MRLPAELGDMDSETFRRSAHQLVDWISDYLAGGHDHRPVLSQVEPGEIRRSLPTRAPEHGEPVERILDDFERILLPGITQWNHPAFFAYFNSTGSAPGVLAEFLTAALNQQAMLWRTSPAATELEEVATGWLRGLLGLPESFEGVINDSGSSSTFHALLAAREAAVADVRMHGLSARSDVPRLRVYCSELAHSSVDKALMALGMGHAALRKIPVDDAYRMRPDALKTAIGEDRAAGMLPVAVVATVGTTSAGSVDPMPAIASLCRTYGMWLHVDACHAGTAAMLPEHATIFDGVQDAHSVVVNPHKWMFTPMDASVLFCRRIDTLRASLALTPDYLETREAGAVHNLMDTGIALGRRLRALKLWMVMRVFGAEGLRARLREHIRLAHEFARWDEADANFELMAPVALSLVCFRAAPRGIAEPARDQLNEELLERVNATGQTYLSHTRLRGHYVLRLAVGHIRTAESHLAHTWSLLRGALR